MYEYMQLHSVLLIFSWLMRCLDGWMSWYTCVLSVLLSRWAQGVALRDELPRNVLNLRVFLILSWTLCLAPAGGKEICESFSFSLYFSWARPRCELVNYTAPIPGTGAWHDVVLRARMVFFLFVLCGRLRAEVARFNGARTPARTKCSTRSLTIVGTFGLGTNAWI